MLQSRRSSQSASEAEEDSSGSKPGSQQKDKEGGKDKAGSKDRNEGRPGKEAASAKAAVSKGAMSKGSAKEEIEQQDDKARCRKDTVCTPVDSCQPRVLLSDLRLSNKAAGKLGLPGFMMDVSQEHGLALHSVHLCWQVQAQLPCFMPQGIGIVCLVPCCAIR